MPKSLKTFAINDRFVTNTRFKEHAFGELSTDSRTYQKDVEIFIHPTDKEISLAVFESLDANGGRVPANAADVKLTIDVAKFVYDTVIEAARDIPTEEMANKILEAFRQWAKDIRVGNSVTNNTVYCPTWVKFKNLSDNEYHIWFSDAAFKQEFDSYEIEVVMPVDNIDVFFSSKSVIEAELAKKPIDKLTEEANVRKATSPVTSFRLDIFNWYNPATQRPELPTNWYVLIWGDAGANLDAVKLAIQKAILAKSKHRADEWKAIFPDIFKRNEFVIVPQWDKFANENKVREEASLYSPIMDYTTMVSKYATPFMAEYPANHVNANLQCMGLYFRGVVGVVCGSNENKEDKFKISQVYPDYIDVASTSTDFAYQAEATQAFSLRLQEMLEIAEKMTETSAIPREKVTQGNGQVVAGARIYSRVIRDGKMFLATKFGDYHYLVAAKKNFR